MGFIGMEFSLYRQETFKVLKSGPILYIASTRMNIIILTVSVEDKTHRRLCKMSSSKKIDL
jgi:hypothetical protein